MSDVLSRDADALHRALDTSGDEVELSLSRETAEWLARIVDARANGQEVVLTRGGGEVTPAEAAALLGISRPQVRKLMDEGALRFRKVGTHHRVTLESLQVYRDAQRAHRRVAMEELSRLQNELGLLE
ncbi:helix-turn-helix domain-containing protein [Agromyces archimandritae]|uniref:Helix-turn-helix domain-containing protein n=1 Tax=Agromyces archimandritae TaxID=2781962 RepID=A0A975FKF7_9MICO|nr:helix-turn-helix domain-containing protein [Agromyces archimandritae]QTX03567.1 helix-turn-helix domain-containing protein [Agromyces archimandritae]